MCVVDDERDLRRRAAAEALVAADAHDVVAEQRHESDPVVVVDDREPFQVARRDPRVGTEVAQVPGALGKLAVEGDQAVRVGGHDRSQMDGAAVGEDHVGFPVTRVVERASGALPTASNAHEFQSLGSSGSSPCSGNTARRVSRIAASTGSLSPSPHGR